MNETPTTDVVDQVALALSSAEVRTFTRDGQPWFAINDLVAALDVPRRTLDHHAGHLPDNEKRHIPRPTILPSGLEVGSPGLHCVSLTGMFKLLMRINSPAALTFQDWVCRTVLLPMWDRQLDRP